jgi:membrane fusion protein, copper/silver efflux system
MTMIKKIAIWTGIVAGGFALAVLLFMIGRWTAPVTTAEAVANAEAADAAPERKTVYTCPMHPQVRETDPSALCPICAMELVPLEDDDDEPDDGELPRLRVSERAAALMNVQTVPARRTEAKREVRLYGRIDFDERLLRTITAWAPGRLDELFIDFTGQTIDRDEPMAKLYSPELIAAQEELLSAIDARDKFGERNRGDMAAGVEAARERLRLLGVSPVFIDELETTREVRDHITIHAPMRGTVVRRLIREGEYINTGDSLFAIADLSHLWVNLSVFESDLLWLSEGQPVEFTTQSVPGRTFEGSIAFIDPVLDDRTRSVRVRVDLPNDDGRLKPGMFVQGLVRAAVDEHGYARGDAALPLVIPASAPLITGRRAVVYVKLRDTERPTFEARDVLLGPRVGDLYVVLEGIDDRDLVVVNGQFRIDSELQIRGRPSMMQPARIEEEAKMQAWVTEDHPALAVHPDDVPDAFAEQLVNVLDEYFALSDAMAQDDYDTAASIAHEMHERLYEIDVSDLDDRVREAWEMLDRDLHEHLHAMLEAADLDAIRPPLEPLTEFVVLMVVNFIGDRAGTIYRAHCPMVDDFRGADWLQRETAIANPYFGSQMFRCGEIVGEVRTERHEGTEAERHEEERDGDEGLYVDIEFPDDFRDAVLAAIDHFDEIAGAIEHGHEGHARDAARSMQDALFALELDALDDAMTQAWLRMDIDMLDALRAMLEADSLDAMRDQLPHLRERVEHAREVLANEGGDT